MPGPQNLHWSHWHWWRFFAVKAISSVESRNLRAKPSMAGSGSSTIYHGCWAGTRDRCLVGLGDCETPSIKRRSSGTREIHITNPPQVVLNLDHEDVNGLFCISLWQEIQIKKQSCVAPVNSLSLSALIWYSCIVPQQETAVIIFHQVRQAVFHFHWVTITSMACTSFHRLPSGLVLSKDPLLIYAAVGGQGLNSSNTPAWCDDAPRKLCHWIYKAVTFGGLQIPCFWRWHSIDGGKMVEHDELFDSPYIN